MNDLAFLEEEGICSEEELEQRYKEDSSWDDINWDDELAKVIGFLEEEQRSKSFTREERIAACGTIGHTPNHLGRLVTVVYRCGCLECLYCFERAKEKEILRLKSVNGPLYITIIPSRKGSAAKKHIRRYNGLYRQYPMMSGQDVYVVDEPAKKALRNHSRMRLKFKQLKQMLTWKRVLKYVPHRHRSGSLGKPYKIELEEEEKIRIIFPRAIVHQITARQKRELWLEAMKLTPDAPEPTAEAIQTAAEIRFNTWIGLCESAGANIQKFGVQVRLVPISQLKEWISSCEIRPSDLYAMCPDYLEGVMTGMKEPARVFA